jgi:uncharacterized protein involved in exopolysaccharide biosynthesis
MQRNGKEALYAQHDELDFYDIYLALRKRQRLILGVLLAATILAGVLIFVLSPVYRSSFMVRAPFLENLPDISVSEVKIASSESVPVISTAETEKLLNKLEDLRDEKRFGELSRELGIEQQRLKDGLVSLESKALRDETNLVEIILEVHEPELIKDLRVALLKFLNDNEFLKTRISSRRKQLVDLSNQMQEKITDLEVLKKSVSKGIKDGNLKNLGFNPIELEMKTMALKKQLMDLEVSYKMLKGFDVAVEPVVSMKPVRPKKVLTVAVAGITALFLGIFLAIFLEWVEKSEKKEQAET